MPRKPYYFYGGKPLKEYCYEEGLPYGSVISFINNNLDITVEDAVKKAIALKEKREYARLLLTNRHLQSKRNKPTET